MIPLKEIRDALAKAKESTTKMMVDDEHCTFISYSTLDSMVRELEEMRSRIEELEKREEVWQGNVGMLRQWLNEDKIKNPANMVSNDDIIYWLSLRPPTV